MLATVSLRTIKLVHTAIWIVIATSHVSVMRSGGYDVELGDRYSDGEKYVVNALGQYLAALWKGKLLPVTPFQRHFIKVSQGKAKTGHFAEKAWLKFVREYPHIMEIQ